MGPVRVSPVQSDQTIINDAYHDGCFVSVDEEISSGARENRKISESVLENLNCNPSANKQNPKFRTQKKKKKTEEEQNLRISKSIFSIST